MATAFYSSLADAEVIEVEFVKLDGSTQAMRLLVDSGFTGSSSFVLPDSAADLAIAALPARQTTGALQGSKNRAWVTCRIAALNYEEALIAIIADTATLSLPAGVDGLAGLTFLRRFAQWGARLTNEGWQFFLSDGRNDAP
jgi:predicted aspartyl protease